MTQIHTQEELNEQLNQHPEGLLIFKNSPTCGISRMAFKQFVSDENADNDALPVVVIDVKGDRPLSLSVAEKFGIEHQSPQLLAIKNNSATYHASHHQIDYKLAKASL